MGSLSDAELFVLADQLALPPDRLVPPNDWEASAPFTPLFLDSDNDKAGYVDSLVDAWLSGRPFCCNVRSEVVVVDIDHSDQPYLQDFRQLIDESGFPVLEVASGGMNRPNRHFYLWAPDESARDPLVHQLKSIRRQPVRVGNGQRIRLPGVRHRQMRQRALPVDDQQARAFLKAVTPSVETLWSQARPSTREAADAQPPEDRSSWDQHVIFQMVLDGLSAGQIVCLALHVGETFSTKARDLAKQSPQGALRYLLGSIRSAERLYAKSYWGEAPMARTRADADWMLGGFAAAVAAADPAMFGGMRDARVLAGVVDLCREQSTFERPMGVRCLADRVGVGTESAVRRLGRLVEGGWISRTDVRGPACGYRLETRKLWTLLGTTVGGCVPRSVPLPRFSRPHLFCHGFGNESGWRAYQALQALGGEAGTGQIAAEAHLRAGDLGLVLNRLSDLGVVEKVRHGVWRLTGADVDLLAEQWGADVVLKNRRRRMEMEQIAYGQLQLARLVESGLITDASDLVVRNSWSATDSWTGEVVRFDDLRRGAQQGGRGGVQ